MSEILTVFFIGYIVGQLLYLLVAVFGWVNILTVICAPIVLPIYFIGRLLGLIKETNSLDPDLYGRILARKLHNELLKELTQKESE